jgi:hypothetical protein
MKNYSTFSKGEQRQNDQAKLDELLLFQDLLRSSKTLDVHFSGKATEIAEGLQPWIDALRCRLKD